MSLQTSRLASSVEEPQLAAFEIALQPALCFCLAFKQCRDERERAACRREFRGAEEFGAVPCVGDGEDRAFRPHDEQLDVVGVVEIAWCVFDAAGDAAPLELADVLFALGGLGHGARSMSEVAGCSDQRYSAAWLAFAAAAIAAPLSFFNARTQFEM